MNVQGTVNAALGRPNDFIDGTGPPTVNTPYQTLTVINTFDYSKFESVDKGVFEKHWDEVFISNSVSDDIYDAISSISGNPQSKGLSEQASETI